MNIENFVKEFVDLIQNNIIEIYNESSIQYELAIFLRQKLTNYKIQLERNISYFNLNKKEFEKKEIDIVLFNENEKIAIELKFPTNGQYPEQFFSFAKDIKFLEELKQNEFNNNIFIAFTNDKNFWCNKGEEGTIYNMFRKQKKIYGNIEKPTKVKGKKIDKTISLVGKYDIQWKRINDELKYFIIKV